MDVGIQCQGWHYIEYIPVTGFWHPYHNDVFYTCEFIMMNLIVDVTDKNNLKDKLCP
jgi:hypothetical protein